MWVGDGQGWWDALFNVQRSTFSLWMSLGALADPEQEPVPAWWDMSCAGGRDHLTDSLRWQDLRAQGPRGE